MNERIRELQSKSYLMCKQIVDDDGHVVVTPDKWFDKFAELLVRECAEVAAKVGEGYVKMGYVVPLECSNKIKEHFGVE